MGLSVLQLSYVCYTKSCSVDPIQQKSIDYDMIIIPDTVTSPTIPALSFPLCCFVTIHVHVQLARESRRAVGETFSTSYNQC